MNENPPASNAASTADVTLSYWVFQFLSEDGNREVEAGGPGTKVDWRLTAYKTVVKAGDFVFFWRAAGPRSALIGWGEVTGMPFEDVDEDISRIRVTTRALFDSPIAKEEILGNPALTSIHVFSGRSGTNFRLSVDQAAALIEMLGSRGLPHPRLDREALTTNLQARIERNANQLKGIADSLPESPLRSEYLSAVDALSGKAPNFAEAMRKLRLLTPELLKLQKEDGWRSTANVDAISEQVGTDVEQLTSLSGPADEPEAENSAAAPMAPAKSAAPATPAAAPPTPTIVPPGAPALQPAPAPVPPPSPPPTPTAPKDHWYCTWEKDDLVNIKPQVSNLARYVVHQELVPPRAIGVFGDWGSGKSFFLRALRSDIALYADQSRKAREAGKTTVFCGHVVQIEFNAWHYVESNLWASVAGYVFEQLYAELQQSTQAHTDENELNALYQSLELYKEAVAERRELEKEGDRLIEARDAAENESKSKRQERAGLLESLLNVAKFAAQNAFAAIPEEDKQKLRAVATSANIENAEVAIAEAKQVVEEGRTTFGRVRLGIQTWGADGFWIAAAITLAILIGTPLLVAYAIKQWLPTLQPLVANLGVYVAAASAALTWLSKKAGTPVKIANQVLDILSNAEASTKSAALAKLEALNSEIEALENKISATDTRITEQQRLITEARDAVDPRNLGTKLKRFLEERARSEGYEKHLGLITLVRRDFDKLSELMRKYWSQRQVPVAEAVSEADAVVGAPVQFVPFIERIVLYIDDLDRCPPEKVVEVLQAVHLMLGFQLFVVVVAVDVRWVRESLLKHYPGLLSNAALAAQANATPGPPLNAAANRQSDERADADDYLEKIFQIPFRIPRLNGDNAEQLVKGLLKNSFLGPQVGAGGLVSVPTLDLYPKELKLYQPEELAITSLSRSIGVSPRRIRRFLDQYMIMRAGMDDGVVELIRTTNDFQVILGLFAMLSGSASVAPHVLQDLYAAVSKTGTPSIGQNLASWMAGNAAAKRAEPYELQALTSAARHIDSAQSDPIKLVSALKQWIPEVARYSFREISIG